MASKLRLPTFSTPVEDWIEHVHGYLATTTATSATKHSALVAALPTDVALQVSKALLTPTKDEEYDELRAELLKLYQRPDTEYIRNMQNLRLGDGQPSDLWRQMVRTTRRCRTTPPEYMLRELHLQKLPDEISLALTCAPADQTLEDYLRMADLACYRISNRRQPPTPSRCDNDAASSASSTWAASCNEVSASKQSVVPVRRYTSDFSVAPVRRCENSETSETRAPDSVPLTETAALSDQMHHLVAKVNRLLSDNSQALSPDTKCSENSGARARQNQITTENHALSDRVNHLSDQVERLLRGNSRASRPENRGNNSAVNGYCYYHNRFGDQAIRCREPCSYPGNE